MIARETVVSHESRATVLLVEDEQEIRRFVRTALHSEHYRVLEAGAIRDGLVTAGNEKPDLVILDLGLPDGDGVQFMHDFRHWSPVPVLVLSARSAEKEKIAALDAGADDYLTKPFAVGELLARVRALLRRGQQLQVVPEAHLSFSDVSVDMARRVVTRHAEPVHLTPIEYRLLVLLVTNAGKVMTHRHLLREIWGAGQADNSHYLRVYVGHLRQKLEKDPAQPQHILTETAVGYRFVF
ncbi:MAG TPA: two-component system response regulator KdpE [Pseudomonadales bacterium]|nr:two-component system response regulator KdpE [Pseudomonadales bacterium]